MANRCEGCPRNCCVDFKLTKELTDPLGVKEELRKFPFIKRTGSSLVIGPSGHERVVGIYNCDRYDPETGECRNHDTEPRPLFCHTTGGKFIPHPRCLLRTKKCEDEQA